MSKPSTNIDWQIVVAVAARIVRSYNTGVTLRQLFYRLVSAQILPNTQTAYKTLSDRTTKERRAGNFPQLIDLRRAISRPQSFATAGDAMEMLRAAFRIDHTEGQPYQVYLAIEKAGLTAQLSSWFSYRYAFPILALGGYESESFDREITAAVRHNGRPAVLLYAGDFDPSGEDILRNFVAQTACWSKVIQVALTDEQVATYGLPENPGKTADARAAAFAARHGRLVQVEVDALDPGDLRRLFQDEIDELWDTDAEETMLARESEERSLL